MAWNPKIGSIRCDCPGGPFDAPIRQTGKGGATATCPECGKETYWKVGTPALQQLMTKLGKGAAAPAPTPAPKNSSASSSSDPPAKAREAGRLY